MDGFFGLQVFFNLGLITLGERAVRIIPDMDEFLVWVEILDRIRVDPFPNAIIHFFPP